MAHGWEVVPILGDIGTLLSFLYKYSHCEPDYGSILDQAEKAMARRKSLYEAGLFGDKPRPEIPWEDTQEYADWMRHIGEIKKERDSYVAPPYKPIDKIDAVNALAAGGRLLITLTGGPIGLAGRCAYAVFTGARLGTTISHGAVFIITNMGTGRPDFEATVQAIKEQMSFEEGIFING